MKAKKRNSNDEWQEVEYVQLKDSYVITKADQMEFDIPYEKEQAEDEHWQDLRKRAAIAAMQGTITILGSSDRTAYREVVVEGFRGKLKTFPNEIAELYCKTHDDTSKEVAKGTRKQLNNTIC